MRRHGLLALVGLLVAVASAWTMHGAARGLACVAALVFLLALLSSFDPAPRRYDDDRALTLPSSWRPPPAPVAPDELPGPPPQIEAAPDVADPDDAC